jgi:FkbM family methyltransferase
MWINHLVQVDLELPDRAGRFWMDTCAGRDQVARAALAGGWRSFESPLPALITRWCSALKPVFTDIGANTGFYSLLAAASGAQFVHAFEPVEEIADVLNANLLISELKAMADVHRLALGKRSGDALLYFPEAGHGLIETSASLNKDFRSRHSEQRIVQMETCDGYLLPKLPEPCRLLLKVDVETAEPDVLTGAEELIERFRPAVVCEILPSMDTGFYEEFMVSRNYSHYRLTASGWCQESERISADTLALNHLFLPGDDRDAWIDVAGGEIGFR